MPQCWDCGTLGCGAGRGRRRIAPARGGRCLTLGAWAALGRCCLAFCRAVVRSRVRGAVPALGVAAHDGGREGGDGVWVGVWHACVRVRGGW